MKFRPFIMLAVLILLFSVITAAAYAEMDYGTVYETAIHLASNDLLNIQNLNDATEMFEYTGAYGYSRSYLIYFQQIIAVQSSDPDLEKIIHGRVVLFEHG